MINIRKMTLKDIFSVAEIEKETFSIPWSEKAFQESLSLNNTIYVVAEEADKIVAYCGIYISMEDGNITNVAVSKNHRRKHIGEQAVAYLLRLAKEQGVKHVTLEVRQTNVSAIRLYEKLGFREAGIRKDFYDKPKEHALIMWKLHL